MGCSFSSELLKFSDNTFYSISGWLLSQLLHKDIHNYSSLSAHPSSVSFSCFMKLWLIFHISMGKMWLSKLWTSNILDSMVDQFFFPVKSVDPILSLIYLHPTVFLVIDQETGFLVLMCQPWIVMLFRFIVKCFNYCKIS